MKNKLEPEEVIKLKLKGSANLFISIYFYFFFYQNLFYFVYFCNIENSDEETSLIGLAGGLCFDFN